MTFRVLCFHFLSKLSLSSKKHIIIKCLMSQRRCLKYILKINTKQYMQHDLNFVKKSVCLHRKVIKNYTTKRNREREIQRHFCFSKWNYIWFSFSSWCFFIFSFKNFKLITFIFQAVLGCSKIEQEVQRIPFYPCPLQTVSPTMNISQQSGIL